VIALRDAIAAKSKELERRRQNRQDPHAVLRLTMTK
jgi:hypothetical protein